MKISSTMNQSTTVTMTTRTSKSRGSESVYKLLGNLKNACQLGESKHYLGSIWKYIQPIHESFVFTIQNCYLAQYN